MVFITEGLIRKRAEHNEGLIYSLQEISLHQSDIEKIENIDKWCRDLKILYLQSNLIDKIENVGKLKQLEYLNLALNNVAKVENLEKCENLNKLDLTVNFIAELTSIESLRSNEFLQEMYMTGNPCAKFDNYREYVIATLPQVERLDGIEVTNTERLEAIQSLKSIRESIVWQQKDYFIKQQKTKEGAGGRWYTDIGAETPETATIEELKPDSELTPEEIKQKNDAFWKSPAENTPETRKAIHKKLEEEKAAVEEQRKGIRTNEVPKRETVLEREGKRLNLNQAKWPFKLDDSTNENSVKLEVTIPKYLSTHSVDVDVQPTYVKIVAENRHFQLVLNDEICPDKSTCQRSQMTGILVLTMPTAKQTIVPEKVNNKPSFRDENSNLVKKKPSKTTGYLEVDPSKKSNLDFSNIVNDSSKSKAIVAKRTVVKEKVVSADFVDDLDVPPLF